MKYFSVFFEAVIHIGLWEDENPVATWKLPYYTRISPVFIFKNFKNLANIFSVVHSFIKSTWSNINL